jgi:hypothetical protein
VSALLVAISKENLLTINLEFYFNAPKSYLCNHFGHSTVSSLSEQQTEYGLTPMKE